jgi:segregation and condensation protein B
MTLDSTQDQTTNQPDSLSDAELRAGVEAVLMITDAPVSLVALATALEQPVNVIREAVIALRDDYDSAASGSPRGFELREVGGGWRIFVRQEFDWAVKLFVANENPTKLSQAALETLAVIAYKQPISRGQVASIRAVNVDSVVKTLLNRGLITELYTDSETGAVHFGTTALMLELLGINSLDELPPISPYLPGADSDFDE